MLRLRLAAFASAILFCAGSVFTAPNAMVLSDSAASVYREETSAEALLNTDIDLQAEAMALMECSTGTLIAERNCTERLPMASTTKIMTALVVIKNCSLDDVVTVPEEAVGVEGSSMYLCLGERITVKDLLYGLMLASGNDAAVALACHAAGSSEGFADMMNAEAESMGLRSTHFVTPNGLTASGHETTALELCRLACEALREPVFREIVSTRYYTAESGDHARTFKNKNALLWDYEGAIGVKTGYTIAAGRCLVFAAERDGMTVVGALLNCRPMFEKAALLLDLGFENFALCTVIPEGTLAAYAKVENGTESVLAAVTKNSIMALMRKGGSESFTASVSLMPLTAPISAGEVIGSFAVYRAGVRIAYCELTSACDVPARGMPFWFRALAGSFA